jgi:hypothetical protein
MHRGQWYREVEQTIYNESARSKSVRIPESSFRPNTAQRGSHIEKSIPLQDQVRWPAVRETEYEQVIGGDDKNRLALKSF